MRAKSTVPSVTPPITVDTGMLGGMATPPTTMISPIRRAIVNKPNRTPANEPLPPHALALGQIPRIPRHTRCHGRNVSMNIRSDPPSKILSAVDSLVRSKEGRWAMDAPFEHTGSPTRALADSRLPMQASQLFRPPGLEHGGHLQNRAQ